MEESCLYLSLHGSLGSLPDLTIGCVSIRFGVMSTAVGRRCLCTVFARTVGVLGFDDLRKGPQVRPDH